MKEIASRHSRIHRALFFLLSGCLVLSTSGAFAQYAMVDLGPNRPFAISNHGQLVGEFCPGLSLGGSAWFANAINDSGQIVGESYTPSNTDQHAVLYSGGVLTDLGSLGGGYSTANGINNHGQIVGMSYLAGATYHAFLYENGVMSDLGTLGGAGDSEASGINDNGQIVGQADAGVYGYPTNHAFLYSGGAMLDLGTLGGVESCAYGINSNGVIVGQAYLAGNAAFHAFLYSDGVMKDLGTLGGTSSSAYAVNNRGQVVGYSYTPGNAATHAFLYSGGVMRDLNNLVPTNAVWTLNEARGINDRGQIAADGVDISWEPRGFLLTPASRLAIALTGQQVTLSWSSNAFASFALQTNTSILSTNWDSVSTGITFSSGVFRASFPASGASCFYRLIISGDE
jgi:probable HAF family extracellular repeat protein